MQPVGAGFRGVVEDSAAGLTIFRRIVVISRDSEPSDSTEGWFSSEMAPLTAEVSSRPSIKTRYVAAGEPLMWISFQPPAMVPGTKAAKPIGSRTAPMPSMLSGSSFISLVVTSILFCGLSVWSRGASAVTVIVVVSCPTPSFRSTVAVSPTETVIPLRISW